MAKKSFKPGTLLAPLPAVLVTCSDGEKDNVLTVAWTGIINSEPPMTYVSVRKSRFSHDIIEHSGEYVINLTTKKIARATDFCGVKSGRDMDKFKEAKLTKVDANVVDCPLIAESPVNLECKVVDILSFPTHDMFISEIVSMSVNEEIIDEKGKIDLAKADLICYSHGDYVGIEKEKIGGFGFSVMKKKTQKKKSKEEHEKRVQKNREKRSGAK